MSIRNIETILNKIEKNLEKTIEEAGLSKVPEGQQFWEGSMDVIEQIRKTIIKDASNKLYGKEITQEQVDDEEWHDIHDDINEAKRNGEIE